jgi:hypothetical protein
VPRAASHSRPQATALRSTPGGREKKLARRPGGMVHQVHSAVALLFGTAQLTPHVGTEANFAMELVVRGPNQNLAA